MSPAEITHPDLAAVHDIVREHLDAESAAELVALIRLSVGFTIANGVVGAASSTSPGCYFGGNARLPDDVDWPRYRDIPMVLLAQIDCAEVTPLLGPELPLPADGRLLFFYEDDFIADFSADGDDGCRVLHVPDPVRSARNSHDLELAQPSNAHAIPALRLLPQTLLSVPNLAAPEADRAARGDVLALIDLSEALAPLLPTPRHRFLGWCDAISGRPKHLRPLLQVEAESGTAWGEVVNISFWIRDDDLRTGDFSRVRRCLETA